MFIFMFTRFLYDTGLTKLRAWLAKKKQPNRKIMTNEIMKQKMLDFLLLILTYLCRYW